jgi:hypothetical protein
LDLAADRERRRFEIEPRELAKNAISWISRAATRPNEVLASLMSGASLMAARKSRRPLSVRGVENRDALV